MVFMHVLFLCLGSYIAVFIQQSIQNIQWNYLRRFVLNAARHSSASET